MIFTFLSMIVDAEVFDALTMFPFPDTGEGRRDSPSGVEGGGAEDGAIAGDAAGSGFMASAKGLGTDNSVVTACLWVSSRG